MNYNRAYTFQHILFLEYNENAFHNHNLIYHVDGIPGSGKTYICSKITLPNSVCVDNDDIVLYAKNYVDSLLGTSQEMPRTFNSVNKIIKRKVDEIIADSISKGIKIIIFVGVRFMVDTALNDATHKYFIRLDDLEYTFRRVLLRETEKIFENYEDIKKIINNTKLEASELDDMILRKCNLALNYPPEFSDYKGMYKYKLGICKKNNYKIMTQDQIINKINYIRFFPL